MLENSKIIVDIDSCTKCKACVDECHYYYFDSNALCLTDEADEYCIECGKCVAVCPANAIKLKVHKDEILRDVPTKENLPSFNSPSQCVYPFSFIVINLLLQLQQRGLQERSGSSQNV